MGLLKKFIGNFGDPFMQNISKNFRQLIRSNPYIFIKIQGRYSYINIRMVQVEQITTKACQGVDKKNKSDSELKIKCFDKWSIEQDLKYADFLKEFEDKLETEHLRRISKVFVLMGEKIKTKNAEQCRTHHQKMVKGYSTIDQIIAHIFKKKNKKEMKLARKGKRGRPRKQHNEKKRSINLKTSDSDQKNRDKLIEKHFSILLIDLEAQKKKQYGSLQVLNELGYLESQQKDVEISVIVDFHFVQED